MKFCYFFSSQTVLQRLHILLRMLKKAMINVRTYVPSGDTHTHTTAPYIFFCSCKLKALTVISIPFHKLFETKAIFNQFSLCVIQRSFVRVRSSERDVNHCCKGKDISVQIRLRGIGVDSTETTEVRANSRLCANVSPCSYISPSSGK
jgi:hypothetical protein